MNFELIYEQVLSYFPEIIDISDGSELDEGTAFKSNNLSEACDSAESMVKNNAEGYLVWAVYKVLHQRSKQEFAKGNKALIVRSISKKEFEQEYRKVLKEAEPEINRTSFCCNMMAFHVRNNCDLHDSKYDCPDRIIDTDEKGETFKILIHDGGTSGIEINYCPWCGTRLK